MLKTTCIIFYFDGLFDPSFIVVVPSTSECVNIFEPKKPSNNFSVSYVDPVNNGFMHGSEGHNLGCGFTATEASLSTVSYLNDNTYKGTHTLSYQNPQEVASNYGYNSDPND